MMLLSSAYPTPQSDGLERVGKRQDRQYWRIEDASRRNRRNQIDANASRFVGRGADAIILKTTIAAASSRGVRRLSLETGSGSFFHAALAWYQKHGFTKGEAYSSHTQTEFNLFLHLKLNRMRNSGLSSRSSGHCRRRRSRD